MAVHVCILSYFSCVRLVVSLWTLACQVPLSMGFSRQEYLSGLLFSLSHPSLLLPCLSFPSKLERSKFLAFFPVRHGHLYVEWASGKDIFKLVDSLGIPHSLSVFWFLFTLSCWTGAMVPVSRSAIF